jgi:hypothetical protein
MGPWKRSDRGWEARRDMAHPATTGFGMAGRHCTKALDEPAATNRDVSGKSSSTAMAKVVVRSVSQRVSRITGFVREEFWIVEIRH